MLSMLEFSNVPNISTQKMFLPSKTWQLCAMQGNTTILVPSILGSPCRTLCTITKKGNRKIGNKKSEKTEFKGLFVHSMNMPHNLGPLGYTASEIDYTLLRSNEELQDGSQTAPTNITCGYHLWVPRLLATAPKQCPSFMLFIARPTNIGHTRAKTMSDWRCSTNSIMDSSPSILNRLPAKAIYYY